MSNQISKEEKIELEERRKENYIKILEKNGVDVANFKEKSFKAIRSNMDFTKKIEHFFNISTPRMPTVEELKYAFPDIFLYLKIKDG